VSQYGAGNQSANRATPRGNASEIANRLDKVADAYRLMGRYDDALVYLEQAKAQLAKTDAKQEVAINQQYFGQVYAAQIQLSTGSSSKGPHNT